MKKRKASKTQKTLEQNSRAQPMSMQEMSAHLNQLRPDLSRKKRSFGRQKERKRFLIICEGEQSEPNYFDFLKKRWKVNAEIRVIRGAGDPLNIVERAIKEAEHYKEYDQIWAVFDHDNVPAKRLNEAFLKARKEKINIAFSNEAFELWLVLHFNYYDSALNNASLCDKLSNLLNKPYDKADKLIFEELMPKIIQAYTNAERLNSVNGRYKKNPYTGVYLLVKELATYSANAVSINNETDPIVSK